jgi:hypothetical protein
MTAPNGIDDKKNGRVKRLAGMTTVLAAIILIILRTIYPLVPPTAMATIAVLLAMLIAAAFNFLYERRKQ